MTTTMMTVYCVLCDLKGEDGEEEKEKKKKRANKRMLRKKDIHKNHLLKRVSIAFQLTKLQNKTIEVVR